MPERRALQTPNEFEGGKHAAFAFLWFAHRALSL